MAFTRVLSTMMRDKDIGPRVVPIVADETRTFGMEGLFRQIGIYSPVGQLYKPQDAAQLMYYREAKDGQILQEGISEAGAMCSWIAAATSYSTNNVPMIPMFIFYSMFGFQRIGDLIWASGDMRSRGFLIGGTSGRTTLNGEGLQHEDGQSQIMASFIPNCVSYDPTFSYEVAVIVQDGLRRMIADQEDVFYYITVMNENYIHPDMPSGAEEGILRGCTCLRDAGNTKSPRVQLMGSGTILREALEAATLLENDFGVAADVWSATSFNQLRRDGLDAQRWNLLHPDKKPRSIISSSSRSARARGRSLRERLYEDVHRGYSSVCRQSALPRAGNRRIRAQRLPQEIARLLRSRPALDCAGGAQESRGGWNDRCLRRRKSDQETRNRSEQTESGDRVIMARRVEIKVPNIGDFKDVPVIDVLVKAGDKIDVDSPLVTVESEKASMDIPSPSAGVVESVTVKVGDKISEGSHQSCAARRRQRRCSRAATRRRSQRPAPRSRAAAEHAKGYACRTSATSKTFRSSKSW